jgi:hypothetical protein
MPLRFAVGVLTLSALFLMLLIGAMGWAVAKIINGIIDDGASLWEGVGLVAAVYVTVRFATFRPTVDD